MTHMNCSVRISCLAWLLTSTTCHFADAAPLSFNRDIRPILADTCFHCHGPDPGSRQADLRLDREEPLFTGDRPLIVRGDAAESPLFKRIMSTNPDEVMPPPDAHKQLTSAQKALIGRWIDEGAKWQPHWSFIAPKRPETPQVADQKWIRNPIDAFVLAGLETAGLKPAPEAEKATLCRRAYLDATGLPPTPEEQQAFLDDKRPDAYEKLVDKLLDSPQYGVHRARYWLDAARYADTHGLHFDNYREMWPYRDWVVEAFNNNRPFDEFTIEQFAGDLLPNATVEQRIATGFHRCNMTTNEGGTIAEENLANYARDRVETTAWVWLGLTANCAVCHDHKFDPLTMRDFYSMSAFFRNTTQGSHDGNIKDTKPVLYLPLEADTKRYAELEGELAAARSALPKIHEAAGKQAGTWQQTVKPEEVDIAKTGLLAALPLAEGMKNLRGDVGGKPATATLTGKMDVRDDGKFGPAPQFAAGSSLELPASGELRHDRPLTVSLWVRPGEKLNDGTLVAWSPARGGVASWELALFQGGKISFSLSSSNPKNNIRAITRGNNAKPGAWIQITATYDGSGRADGLQIFANGRAVDVNRSGTNLVAWTPSPGGVVRLGGRQNNANAFVGGALQDVRVYERKLNLFELATLAQLPITQAAAKVTSAKRNAKNKQLLTEFFLQNVDKASVAAATKLERLEEEQKQIQARSTITHVQEEKMNSPAMANILMRGQYDKPGDQVEPAVFAALNPLPEDAPKNRLGLAQWLVDDKNPLTARVTVNRYWQELFGVGLVKTSEDFGIMGEAPSHPELLDWLAVEFRDDGWDVKHMFRLMLTSSTYRQSAAATPEKIAKDRDNRLLSRGPRFRMDAEMIRDYALAVSGTLSVRMGGPSTKPYQPEGIWDIVGLPGGNTRTYVQDSGENLYRRSVYTFLKRMAPPPNMETFNAPARETSCLRRDRTNTPLQALVTLNDPQFVEASRNLAQRVLKDGKGDPRKTLDLAARRALCRPLFPEEAKVVESGLAEMLSYYHGRKADAEALVKVGESKPAADIDVAQLAAWTNICNMLMNMDEVLNK